jgi:hypothetical protein
MLFCCGVTYLELIGLTLFGNYTTKNVFILGLHGWYLLPVN